MHDPVLKRYTMTHIQSCNKEYVVAPQKCRRLCTCGRQHPTVDVEHYTGDDALDVLGGDCRHMFPRGKILLLNDENTRAAVGEQVAIRLKEKGVRHAVLTLPGRVTATEERAEQVFKAAGGSDLIVAAGAGTINDLCKYAAGKRRIPYWAVPTAPSMNGYTSAIAAIKVAGVKRTLPARPPQFIYALPDVIRNAPLALRQAGYCDLMAKSVSDVDWQIESLLFSGTYCRLSCALVEDTESSFLNVPEKIRDGERRAVMALFNGLLVSGVAMSLAGSSAPASGGEHLFSHFLDMRETVTGRVPELHGLQVAAGIVLSAACYRQLAHLDAARLRPHAETAFQNDAVKLAAIWGNLADEVKSRFLEKREALLQLDQLLPRNWREIKALCRKVQNPRYYLNLMRRTDHAMTLASLDIDADEYLLDALTARTIRERITVLDIAAQANVLEKAAREAMDLMH